MIDLWRRSFPLTSFLTFFLRCPKDIAHSSWYLGHAWSSPWEKSFLFFLFEHFRHTWPHQKNMTVWTCRNLLCFPAQKHRLHSSLLSWDNAKMLQLCYFGYFGNDWPCPPKLINQTCRKVGWLSKNQLHSSFPSWDIAKILQTCHFGYFWPPKTMMSGCWKLWCSFSCKKSNSSLTAFLHVC